jgi:hypothetical protein
MELVNNGELQSGERRKAAARSIPLQASPFYSYYTIRVSENLDSVLGR